MKERTKVGLWVSLILGIYGLVGSFAVFIHHWKEMYDLKIDRLDETFVVEYIIPGLHDLSVIGSALMIVAAYLFAINYKYAWHLAIAGNILAIQGTAFPVVPTLSAGGFPDYIFLFIPNMVAFYLYIAYIRKLSGKAIAVATVVGMIYVLTLFNGIASASRTVLMGGIEGNTAMFVASQQINWIGVVGWYAFLLAILYQKKWAVPVGIFASSLTIMAGLPIALKSTIESGVFSMFLLAPLTAIIILVYILSPSGKRFFSGLAQNNQYEVPKEKSLNI